MNSFAIFLWLQDTASMRISLAQVNPVMGDFKGNADKILRYSLRAKERKSDIVIFPELFLYGYNPTDSLEYKHNVEKQEKQIEWLMKKVPEGIKVLFGCVRSDKNKKIYNSACLIEKSKKARYIDKYLLAIGDIFDEQRFFSQGDPSRKIIKINKQKVLVLICEDLWVWDRPARENYLKSYKDQKIDSIVVINASPFSSTQMKRRRDLVSKTSKYFKCPVAYVNMVGGQDETIFDGGSFVVDKKQKLVGQSCFFEEDLNTVDLASGIGGVRNIEMTVSEMHREALVLGLRDYVEKNGFRKLHLGLSGGIDSAVVACLAADAVGPQNLTCLALPGPFSSKESLSLANSLAKNIGCNFYEISISSSYENMLTSFQSSIGSLEFGLTQENLQARLRGNYLMMFANSHNSLLLSTGNKTELATGYSTLYGDMCGAINPLGDLLKSEVYRLAHVYNSNYELIPTEIIKREPSAELRPNQKDSDSLPAYGKLDAAVDKLVTRSQCARSKTEKWLINRLDKSEFKRWQSPPILRVSDHAFGRGRRVPVTWVRNN